MSLENNKKELPARKTQGGHFDKLGIQKIVEAIEGGMPRSEVCQIYGVSRSTVCDWMREYGSATYKIHRQGRLNNAQKRSMIRAIQEGKITLQEAKLHYHMPSYKAILTLLRKEKENSELSRDMDSQKEHHAQGEDQEKKVLQQALEEAQLKIKALNTLIDVAEDQFKIPIRKKPGAKPSKP